MVDRVYASTLEAINIVHHSAKVVSPSAGVNFFNSLAVFGVPILIGTHPVGPA
jgi:hypothetical protein